MVAYARIWLFPQPIENSIEIHKMKKIQDSVIEMLS